MVLGDAGTPGRCMGKTGDGYYWLGETERGPGKTGDGYSCLGETEGRSFSLQLSLKRKGPSLRFTSVSFLVDCSGVFLYNAKCIIVF